MVISQYYTIILDKSKFLRWLAARKRNGSKTNVADVARMIGYGNSYLSQLLSQKYDIEISGRFIGSFLVRFGMHFEEMFKIVPDISMVGKKKPSEWYVPATNNRRMDESKMPFASMAR